MKIVFIIFILLTNNIYSQINYYYKLLNNLKINIQNPDTTGIQLYIVLGQSNTGWMTIDSISNDSAYYKDTIDNVYMFNCDLEMGALNWDTPMVSGTNTGTAGVNKSTAFGSSVLWGRYLSQNFNKNIYIMTMGRGATSLHTQWHPDTGHLLNEFINYWLRPYLLTQLINKGDINLKAVIWEQGETDVLSQDAANNYYDNLFDFFNALDTGLIGSFTRSGIEIDTTYKLIITQLSDNQTSHNNKSIVQNAQYNFVQNYNKHNVTLITTEDCDVYPLETWHYDWLGTLRKGVKILNELKYY